MVSLYLLPQQLKALVLTTLKRKKTGIELIKTNDADRERGVTNLREVMNIFEAI